MRVSPLPFLLSLLSVSILSVLSHADEKPVPIAPVVPTAESPTLFVDFRKSLPGIFHYGTWQDKLGISATGIVIEGSKGAQGDGGMGRAIEPALDLSRIAYVEVALGVGAKNEVPEIAVALNDADGTQVAARLRIDQIVPNQLVWLHVPRESFTLVSGQGGKDGKMDWTKVAQWQLQGDWTTKKPLNVVFIALRVRN
ncbi:MAG TPA: hypothetical protein VGM64_05675 [Lacunisphaera sp.]|jgi:hypothetical protein